MSNYAFYYDESQHSRLLNLKTVTADEFYDGFVFAIVGWDLERERDLAARYSVFENKYLSPGAKELVSQIGSDALSKNEDIVSTFVKGEIQKLFGSVDDRRAEDIILGANILIIFGLSLGETDMRWWEIVVKFLKDGDYRFVLIASTETLSARRSPASFRRFSKALKDKLLTRGGANDDEKRLLSERIFIIPAGSIFRFKSHIPNAD